MKKLYVIKDEFFAAHPRIKQIDNLHNYISSMYRYWIDPDTFEIFRVDHSHKRTRITSYGKEYNLVLAQIETDGTSRTKQGHKVVKIAGKSFTIARLIASTFIKNPHKYKDILHINHDPLDDRIENLRWCTHKELVQSYYDDVKQQYTSIKKQTKLDKLQENNVKNIISEDDDNIVWSKAYTKAEIAGMALDSNYDD